MAFTPSPTLEKEHCSDMSVFMYTMFYTVILQVATYRCPEPLLPLHYKDGGHSKCYEGHYKATYDHNEDALVRIKSYQ